VKIAHEARLRPGTPLSCLQLSLRPDDSEQMLRLRRPLCSGGAVLPLGKGVLDHSEGMLRLRRPLPSGCAVLPPGKGVGDDSEQMLRLRRPLCSGGAVLPLGKGVRGLVGWSTRLRSVADFHRISM
jgi:hypothetical protein